MTEPGRGISRALPAITLALCTVTAHADTAQGGRRVAVFHEPGFPVYATYRDLDPVRVAAKLQEYGIEADVLGARQLADGGVRSSRMQ